MPDPLDDREVDERFADIVEQWRAQAATEVSGDTATDEASAPPADATQPPVEATPPSTDEALPSPPPDPPDLVIRLDQSWRRPADQPTWDEVLDAEQAEGFTPPEVELPPGEDLHYWGAVIGLVLGPLIVLWVAFASPSSSSWWLLAGVGMAVAGFVLLVLRMPAHKDPEDDDDGARV